MAITSPIFGAQSSSSIFIIQSHLKLANHNLLPRNKMKQANRIFKFLGISTKSGVNFDDVEVLTWSPDSFSRDESLSQVTQLDDGFVVAKKIVHLKILQTVPSTSDIVPNNDDVETLQLAIEANVIIEPPRSESKDDIDSSVMNNNWLEGQTHGNSSECRLDDSQPITIEVVPAKRGKLRKLKKAISKLFTRSSKSSTKVSPLAKTDNAKTFQEMKVQGEPSVCDAVQRMRRRRAMFYV